MQQEHRPTKVFYEFIEHIRNEDIPDKAMAHVSDDVCILEVGKRAAIGKSFFLILLLKYYVYLRNKEGCLECVSEREKETIYIYTVKNICIMMHISHDEKPLIILAAFTTTFHDVLLPIDILANPELDVHMDNELRTTIYDLLNNVISGGIIILYFEENYPVFYINDPMLQFLGYTREEFYQEHKENFITCIYPTDRPYIAEETLTHLDKGNTYEIEYRLIKKDNTVVYVHEFGKKLVLPNGRILLAGACRDITKWYELQQQLNESYNDLHIKTRELEEISNNVPSGFIKRQLQKPYYLDYVSSGFLRLLDYDRIELKERFDFAYLDMIVEEDRAAFIYTMSQKQLSGGSFELEYRVHTRSKDIRWVVDRSSIAEENGELFCYTVINDITKLREMRFYYEHILDQLPIPLFISNNKHELTLVNQASLTLTGEPAEDCLGRDCRNFDIPLYDEKHGDASQEQMTTYLTHRDRHYKMDAATLYDPMREQTSRVCMFSDITELHDVETALRTLTHNIPGGVYEVLADDNFTLLYGNASFYDMCGYTEEELRMEHHNHLAAIIHEKDRPLIHAIIFSSISEGKNSFSYEKRIVRKDKSICWQLTKGSLFYASDTPRMNCVVIDITDRKKFERELRMNEERMRLALKQTSDVIFEYDIRKHSLRHYTDAMNLYDLPNYIDRVPYSLIDKGVIHPDHVADFEKMYVDITAGAESAGCELQVCTSEKTYRWARITLTTIYDEYDLPERAVGIVQDITAQREAEIRYQKEEKYRAMMLTEALVVYELNVTKDTFRYVGDCAEEFDGNNRLSDLFTRIAATRVHTDDVSMFLQMCSIHHLEEQFERGFTEVKMEYRRVTNDGKMIWVANTMHLEKDRGSGDLRALAYIKDIDEKKRKEQQLLYKAERDLLTNLYNKYTTERKINEFLESADESDVHAFMMIDLDNFKAFNDTLGHIFGDAVLSEIASKMSKIFRKSDIIGRIGGDEYVVLVKNIHSIEEAAHKAEEMCEAFRNSYNIENTTVKISGSIGISTYPNHGKDFKTLYVNADAVLYYAKDLGKDRYIFYNESFVSVPESKQRLDQIDGRLNKHFSENMIEYIFKMLYEAKNMQSALESVMKLICDHFKIARACIYEINAASNTLRHTFEWCAEGVVGHRAQLQAVDMLELQEYLRLYEINNTFFASLPSDIPQQAKTAMLLEDVNYMLHHAIRVDGVIRAIIGFEEVKGKHIPKREVLETLQSAIGIIGTFLVNERIKQESARLAIALRNVMDNMDSYTYIVNPKNDELLLVNRKMLGVSSHMDTTLPCYQAFWKQSTPCAICPVKELIRTKQEKYTVDLYSPTVGSWLKASASWMTWEDGNKVALVNCTESVKFK